MSDIYVDSSNNATGSGAVDETIHGNDNPNYISGGVGSSNDVVYAQGGQDTVWGFAGDDTLLGGTGEDYIAGGQGNDKIYAGAGNDIVDADNAIGTQGNDTVFGNAGNDILHGGGGNDWLDGGNDNDTLTGGIGNDVLIGGAGNDTYRFSLGDGKDSVTDTSGNDTIYFDHTIDQNSIALFRNGNNLQISFVGSNDLINVNNYFTTGSIEKIQLNNGHFLTATQVNSIISAMSSAASSGGIALNNINDVKSNSTLLSFVQSAW